MPALIRSSAPRGVRFYEDGEQILFVNVIDATTRVGPELATVDHMAAHPQAWQDFEAQKPPEAPGFKPLVTFSGEEPEAERAEREQRVARRNRRSEA